MSSATKLLNLLHVANESTVLDGKFKVCRIQQNFIGLFLIDLTVNKFGKVKSVAL